MRTSTELLTDILGILVKVSASIDSDKSGKTKERKAPETIQSKATKGLGMNLKSFAQDKATNEKIRDTASTMKILGGALNPLGFAIFKFNMFASDKAKAAIVSFLHDILNIGKDIEGGAVGAAKSVAETIEILSTALPKLAWGTFLFGLSSRMGLVASAAMGIEVLFTALAAASPLAVAALPAAIVLGLIGVALMGVAEVLKSIAIVIVAFAASVVIMIGAIWLASKLFGVSPDEAMGIVVKTIIILAGGFALIGILSPLIILSGMAVASMGVGMGLLGIGLLVFMGAISLINYMTGGQKATDDALIGTFKSIALIAAVFAGIGLFSGLIIMGSAAALGMGAGMIVLSVGILALGGVSALITKLFGLDMFDMLLGVAKGIGVMGLLFAGLGLLAIAIIPGTATLLAMSISLGLFALSVWAIGAVIKQIGGTEGVKGVTSNIELLVGGVIGGVISGFSKGLGTGTEKNPSGFLGMLGKVGQVALNMAALVGAIAMIGSLSFSLILFAMALKAFAIAGVIKTIVGYDKEGKPIFGESIDVANIGNNISLTLGGFFKGLVQTFNDPTKLPDEFAVAKMTNILMGRSGLKLLGITIISGQPGLLDAISKFGDVLTLFAKIDQIPVYEVDKNGVQKVKGWTTPSKIAVNIVSAIRSFFDAFKGSSSTLKNLSSTTAQEIAEVLLGQQAYKFFGLKIGKDKIGILEPLMKFGEVLQTWAKISSDGTIPVEYDKDGKVTKSVNMNTVAYGMGTAISGFLQRLVIGFKNQAGPIKIATASLTASLSTFSVVISQFDTLSKSVQNIDLLGDSVGKLATNIGLLVGNMSGLTADKLDNLQKIADISNKNAVNMTSASKAYVKQPLPGNQGSSWGNDNTGAAGTENWDAIGTKIAQAVMTKLNGQFVFEFPDGKMAGNVTFGMKK